MGFPSPARDYLEPPINIVNELVTDPDCTFVYLVETDVLLNAFVSKGSYVIVVRSLHPQNGCMVLARYEGKDHLAILIKNEHRVWLCPANSKFKSTEITGRPDVEIVGVITYVIQPSKNWAHVCTR